MDSTGTTLGDRSVYRSWPFMTPLEKRLLILSVVFGIVIFSLTIALLDRDYRRDVPSPPAHKERDCTFILSDLSTSQPLLLLADRNAFVYPSDLNNTINSKSRSSILLSCPNSTIIGAPFNESQTVLTCTDSEYEAFCKKVLPKQLNCSSQIFETVKYTGNDCEGSGKEIVIGYQINVTSFVRQITVCFEPISKRTLYTQFTLTKSIGNRARTSPRPFFHQDTFYDTLDLRAIYISQREIINSLLEFPPDDKTYIRDNSKYFLAKGHLAAMSDFVYGVQQNSTFHFINTAPQWQIFNGGNWNNLEIDIRNLAEKRKMDFLVFTGTFGVLSLITGHNQPVEIFLGGESVLPVPKFFWKVVYCEQSKKGVALVGVNHPYVKSITKDLIICRNVTSKIPWLSWNANNFTLGLSYACDVNDLRNNVTYIPTLDIRGLLI